MTDFAAFTNHLKLLFVALFPVIASEEWKSWETEEVTKLNALMHLLNDVYNVKLRPQYDQTFYNLAKTTKVVTGLEPVRKETVRKGSETAAVSADDIFASLVGKVSTETETTEEVES